MAGLVGEMSGYRSLTGGLKLKGIGGMAMGGATELRGGCETSDMEGAGEW